MITLQKITPENYEAARQLDVTAEQKNYVAPVMRSLADAFVYGATFRLAYEGDLPVGYIMVYPFHEEEKPFVNIVRLMIDQRYQGRGLGRALLDATMQLARELSPNATLLISSVPENVAAINLYRSIGFVETGMKHGEIVLRLVETEGGQKARPSIR